MKKTLIALVALTGVVGATTTEFDVSRTDNAVSFTETDDILTLTYTDWSYSGGGSNNVGGWQSPTNANYQNSFSPDAQLRSGTTDSWTMNFTLTNNGEEKITLTKFVFDVYCINGGGSDKNADIPVTLTLGGVSSGVTLKYGGQTAEGVLDLAGGSKSISIGANETVNLSLTMGDAKSYNTYSGITSGSVTYTIGDAVVPEPTTATLSLLALAGLAVRRRRK